jgi:hypothetical protein
MRWPWTIQAEAIAGAVTIPGRTSQDGESKPVAWQSKAWNLWPQLGELYFPSTYLARQVSRVKWDVLVDGDLLDDDSDRRDEIMGRVTQGLGEEEASNRIAINLMVAGEGNYVQEARDDEFRVISVIDPTRNDLLNKAGLFVNLRFYTPDPRDPKFATSSFRPALAPAEELITLVSLSRAQAKSRIPAGIFFTPTQAKFSGADPFGSDLNLAMSLAIADVDHPTAVTPVHVTLDQELMSPDKRPFHLVFERPYDEHIDDKIALATKRIALALDMPAELLLGLGDINHWGAWLISEETYTAHVGPLAQQVGEVFASAWRELTEEVIEVVPDPSELLARKSTVRDAFDALKLGVVGYEYARDAMGADEDDAPTPEDLELIAMLRGADRDPAVEENPGPPAVAAAITPKEVDLDELAHELGSLDRVYRAELLGHVEAEASVVREKIGSRARSAARSDPVIREKIADLPLEEIGSALGLQQLVSLGVEVEKIVDEGMSRLARWWQRRVPLAYQQIARLGVDVYSRVTPEGVDDLAERSASYLTGEVGKWIVENLDRDQPLEPPTDAVRLTVAKAGGQ